MYKLYLCVQRRKIPEMSLNILHRVFSVRMSQPIFPGGTSPLIASVVMR